MDINAISNILKMLKSFSELLKTEMNIETVNTIRELKGSDVLENYEKMFDVDGIGTKTVLKNYIINEVNSLSIAYMEVANYDNNELKEFVKDKLNLPKVDMNKLNFLIEKSKDEDAVELIKHKLSILTYFEKLASNSKYIEFMKHDDNLKASITDIIKKFDILIKIISKNLEDEDFIKFDIHGELYGFGMDTENETDLNIGEYLKKLKDNLPSINSRIETIIKEIKNNIGEVDYKPSLSNGIREKFMKLVDEYAKGIISTDMFDLGYKNQIEVMEFYVNTILAYVESLTSYIDYIKEYSETVNDIDNIINVSYELFNKSE